MTQQTEMGEAMNAMHKCPQCGAPLPPDAPEGQCPKCLLQVGLGSQPPAAEGSASPPPPPPTPAELAPRFPQLEILELLGQGGMGIVYKARQPRLDRLVALKILPAAAAGDPAFAERFHREARALARLSHPNIVTVYDFGESSGIYYLVMEFVDGVNLRHLERSGKLTPGEALQIVPAICAALQFAHDEGIVHRDIKPENILVDAHGRVKIADFGLAKLLGQPPRGGTLTASQQVMGTPHYMAPEQTEKPQTVDHRADIYSLGVVFYEMLTGELPIGRFAPPSQKVHIDVRLDEIVLRALEKDLDRRYQHANDVKTDVETITAHGTPGPPPADPPAPTPSAVDPVRRAVQCAHKAVRGPAIGLIGTGILNWVLIPLYALIGFWLSAHHDSARSFLPMAACLVAVVALSSFMVFTGFKMKALEAHRLAIAGSILCIVISPGNLIGLPLGIWALVTLTRPRVRQAFDHIAQGEAAVLDDAGDPAPGAPADSARRWFFTTATVALCGLVALVLITFALFIASQVIPVLGRAKAEARSHAAATPAVALLTLLRSYTPSTSTPASDLTVTNEAWFLDCAGTQNLRLFEVPDPGVEACTLIYRVVLKTENLFGRAYLEMKCRMPDGEECVSRDLDHAVSGSGEWTTYQTTFGLEKGRRPDRVILNLVVEGSGKLWLREVALLKATPPEEPVQK